MKDKSQRKIISYSAPAKVIISGEHAVVYGKPALVTAIDLRVKFSLWESMRGKKDEYVSEIYKRVKKYLINKRIKVLSNNFDFSIESQVPERRGLGWSTALLAAEVGCFLHFLSGKRFKSDDINNLAYKIEKIFYKNSSGVDISASTLGGLIYYRKEFEFLKNISSLNFRIPKKIEDGLYLIDSGKAVESTGEMVESVGKLYNRKPQFVEEVLNDIEKTTKRIVVSVIKEDADFLTKSIVDNQVLLQMLDVVSNKSKNVLRRLEPFGVGKVTGAGGKKDGSGYLLFYTDKVKNFENYCKKNKLNYFKLKQSHQGVKKEI